MKGDFLCPVHIASVTICISLTENTSQMKRIALYLAGFVLMAIALTSCEGLFENCNLCRQVTLDSGNVINESAEREYCGLELVTIQTTAPSIDGTITIKWECR
jgi:hypothetical protein